MKKHLVFHHRKRYKGYVRLRRDRGGRSRGR